MLSSEYRPGYAETEEDLERYEYLSRYLANCKTPSHFVTMSSQNSEITDANEELSSLGFYVYSYEEPGISPMSDGGDIGLNSAIVMYDSYNNQWIVCGGGSWSTTNWLNDSPLSAYWGMPWAGSTQDLGGYDGVGVALYNTSGPAPTLVRSYAYVHDGTGNEKYFYNPMNLDTSRGVFFDYQDYIRVKDSYIVWANLTYMGYGFSALAVYTSSFANYHGRARTYYAHTWGSTNVTGVGVTTSGFNVSFSHNTNRFVIYQTGETVF